MNPDQKGETAREGEGRPFREEGTACAWPEHKRLMRKDGKGQRSARCCQPPAVSPAPTLTPCSGSAHTGRAGPEICFGQ